jgi:hypothetical protein
LEYRWHFTDNCQVLTAMAITYDSTTNVITVTGYTSGIPCTFDDIYNADVASGWGKVTRQGAKQYYFTAKLIIGDGATNTYFTDISKQVVFEAIFTANNQSLILVMNNAYFTLGVLQDAATKRTYNGCSLRGLEATYNGNLLTPNTDASTCAIYLYGCDLHSDLAELWWQAITAYNINCDGRCYPNILKYNNTFQEYNNIIVSGTGFGIRRSRTTTTVNNFFIMVSSQKLWFQNFASTVKNVYWRGSGTTIRMESNNFNCYVINADDGGIAWTIYWAGLNQGKIYRQYEFDLTTDPNATVTLKDKNGSTVFSFTSDASTGAIATQTVSRGYYNQTNGDTLQDYGSFTLTIAKAGKITYTQTGIVLTAKTNWQIALLSAPAKVFVDALTGKTALNLNHKKIDNQLILSLQ